MLSPILVVIAVCFLGSAILIPIMYFGVHGWVSLKWIWGAAVIGTNITDIIWISIARKLGSQKIENWWLVRKNPKKFKLLEKAVKKHGAKILFWSKFVHGTGILSQFAAGIFKVPWPKALLANFSGALIWTSLVYFVTKGASSLPILETRIADVKVGIIVFIAIAIIINFAGSKMAPKEISLMADGKNDDAKGNGDIE